GTAIAARVGQVLAVGLAVLGWQYNIFLLLIAVFVFLGAGMEYEQVRTSALAGDLTASRLTVTDLRVLTPHTGIGQAIAILTRSDQRAFPVLDEDSRLLGIVTRDDLLRGVDRAGLDAPVTTALATPATTGTIATTLPFEDAVAQLLQSNRDALPVIDESGRFAGLITRDNVTDVLLVQRMRQAMRDEA
ncbi:MAG TPA: CBS domain-containing protein, partial [Gemmatimonadales bacterium]|nr:CBS domain-containing protein [Gemmatimonadales bacterium]